MAETAILGVIPALSVSLDVLDVLARAAARAGRLVLMYGPYGGLYMYLFGSKATWRLEAQILGHLDDTEACGFRDHVQTECTMISVAVRIPLLPILNTRRNKIDWLVFILTHYLGGHYGPDCCHGNVTE